MRAGQAALTLSRKLTLRVCFFAISNVCITLFSDDGSLCRTRSIASPSLFFGRVARWTSSSWPLSSTSASTPSPPLNSLAVSRQARAPSCPVVVFPQSRGCSCFGWPASHAGLLVHCAHADIFFPDVLCFRNVWMYERRTASARTDSPFQCLETEKHQTLGLGVNHSCLLPDPCALVFLCVVLRINSGGLPRRDSWRTLSHGHARLPASGVLTSALTVRISVFSLTEHLHLICVALPVP